MSSDIIQETEWNPLVSGKKLVAFAVSDAHFYQITAINTQEDICYDFGGLQLTRYFLEFSASD